MTSSQRFLTALFSICILTLIASPSFGEISVGVLTKKTAKEKYGITMRARKNGGSGGVGVTGRCTELEMPEKSGRVTGRNR